MYILIVIIIIIIIYLFIYLLYNYIYISIYICVYIYKYIYIYGPWFLTSEMIIDQKIEGPLGKHQSNIPPQVLKLKLNPNKTP